MATALGRATSDLSQRDVSARRPWWTLRRAPPARADRASTTDTGRPSIAPRIRPPYKSPGISARTQRQFWTTYILPIIGDMLLNQVETTDIERATKEAAKISNTTANHIRTCLKTAFNRGQVWKLHIGVNPVKDSKIYPVRKRPHILKEDELLKIISEGEKLLLATIEGKHSSHRLNQIFQIIAILLGPETVRRPSELFRMEWDWIDFKHRIVYLDRAKGDRCNSKEHKGQTFTFSQRGQQLLEVAKHFSGDSKYVFPSKKSDTGHIKTVRTMRHHPARFTARPARPRSADETHPRRQRVARRDRRRGKSTFLDVPHLLEDLLRRGLPDAIRDRSPDVRNLVWMEQSEYFEVALEFGIPEAQRARLPGGQTRARYELALGHDSQGELAVRPAPREGLFPGSCKPRQALGTLEHADTPSGWKRIVGKESGTGKDYFFSETSDWNNPFRLGPGKLALANLPEDEERFPVATWVKRVLLEGVRRLALHSEVMRLCGK